MEKTYRTSEMIAMLGENPNLKFRRPKWDLYNSIGIKDGVLQMIQQNGGLWTYTPSRNPYTDRYEEACRQIGAGGDDWQIVRTPVTWQEALQALIEGRTVLCQCADCTDKVIYKDENRARECSFPTGRAICITALKTGTWYIE